MSYLILKAAMDKNRRRRDNNEPDPEIPWWLALIIAGVLIGLLLFIMYIAGLK